MTRASAGDYRDVATGSAFSMTSGFSTMLKLRADGTFLYQFYSSGVAPDCAFVTNLDSSVGRAALEGGALVLRPTQRTVELGACARSGTYEPGLDPIVMPALLTEEFDLEGHRSWKLDLEGGPVPLSLTLLHRPPSPTPPQPAQPADFVLGDQAPFNEMQGVWTPYPNSDLGFFDPATNAWYLPEYNGATHLWLRFQGETYDLARAWSSYNYEGVCEKDYVYYERGRAQVASLEDIGGMGDHFRGHARFVAEDARLVLQIRDCGSDDGATLYTLDAADQLLRVDLPHGDERHLPHPRGVQPLVPVVALRVAVHGVRRTPHVRDLVRPPLAAVAPAPGPLPGVA